MRKPLSQGIHKRILVKEFGRMNKNPHRRESIEFTRFADQTRTRLAQMIAGLVSSNPSERNLVKAFLLQRGTPIGRLERLGSKELLEKIDGQVFAFSYETPFISRNEEKTEIVAKILEKFNKIIDTEEFLQRSEGK